MNEEENKTFEFVKNCLKTGNIEDFQDIDKYDIETLLNLISKLQKELGKKDKIIDKMYDYIDYYDWKEFEYNTGHSRDEMFEYFCEEEK